MSLTNFLCDASKRYVQYAAKPFLGNVHTAKHWGLYTTESIANHAECQVEAEEAFDTFARKPVLDFFVRKGGRHVHDNVLVSCTHFAAGHELAVGLVDNDKRLEGSILTMQPEVFQKQLPQVFLGDVFGNEPVLGLAVIQSWRKTTCLQIGNKYGRLASTL